MSISSKERTENTSLILASLVNQLEKVGSSFSLDVFFGLVWWIVFGEYFFFMRESGFGVDDYDVGFLFLVGRFGIFRFFEVPCRIELPSKFFILKKGQLKFRVT